MLGVVGVFYLPLEKSACESEKFLDQKHFIDTAYGLMNSKNYTMAVKYFKEAIERGYRSETTLNTLGCALMLTSSKNWKEALECYKEALKINPSSSMAYNNIAYIYRTLHLWQEAGFYYQKALEVEKSSKLYTCFAEVLTFMREFALAEHCLKKAIELDPKNHHSYAALGYLYLVTDRSVLSIDAYLKSLQLNSKDPPFLGLLYFQLKKLCRWDEAKEVEKLLETSTKKATFESRLCQETPFDNLLRTSNQSLNLAVAASWSHYFKSTMTAAPYTNWPCLQYKNKSKFTIGYLSCDYFNHATLHLMAGLFRYHNKDRFKVIAFSYGPDDKSEYRRRLIEDVDEFVDISKMSDEEAARSIYERDVDILVDLKGYTQNTRMQIAAYHPAPLQLTYLGFPGTSGADSFDYVITDKIVTPESDARFYTEKFLYMSNSYQVNDDRQKIANLPVNRATFSLPEKAFVYACFNTPQKIDKELFDVWLELLQKTPKSVLWLYAPGNDHQFVKKKLSDYAASKGVKASRLIFADKLPKDEHLQRLQFADLALDTRMYNGHTTTSDALWAGLPVVAIKGQNFASRVSSSLLHAAGFDELVTTDLKKYKELALSLALSPQKLKKLRERVSKGAPQSALFQTENFVKELENHYLAIYKKRVEENR